VACYCCCRWLQVSAREREYAQTKQELSKLMGGLEARTAADREALAAQTTRLAKESARLEALQVSKTS
jgi:hypothetical protein